MQILEYLYKLKDLRVNPIQPGEIGIITPYRKQVSKIRNMIKNVHPFNTWNIDIGSVEEFQGQERRVIIISTVRSSGKYLEVDISHNLGMLKPSSPLLPLVLDGNQKSPQD